MLRGVKSVSMAVILGLSLVAASRGRDIALVTYNVENLFDADRVAVFDDYAENADESGYSPGKMLRKMQGISALLKRFNKGAGPDIVCFNELEIDFTPESKVTDYAAFLEKYKDTTAEAMLTTSLDDEVRGLPAEALLLKHLSDEGMSGYHVAMGSDKPDPAGAQGAVRGGHKKAHRNGIFSKFPVKAVRSHPATGARDILEAELDLEGCPLTVFVNHWKSGAGNLEFEAFRRANAKTLRARIEQILSADPSSDIIVTGDFNSQYNQSSVYPFMGKTGINEILGSQGDEASTAMATGFSLYNLWHELPPDLRASDQYDGKWGTLMQTMVTPGLYDHHGVQYVDNSFAVVAIDGLNKTGQLGLPRRWSNLGGGSGFSDHFPVSLRLRILGEGDKSKRIVLVNPGKPARETKQRVIGFGRVETKKLPYYDASAASRPAEHLGRLFKVKGAIASRHPLTVEAAGYQYSLWAPDRASVALRPLRRLPTGAGVEFVGLLSTHKGKFQFVVEDPSWILAY